MEARLAGLSHDSRRSGAKNVDVKSSYRRTARKRSPTAARLRAAMIIDSFWRHYEDDRVRARAARALSALLVHDDVWKLVQTDIPKYVKMLRHADSYPFSPNSITACKDAPYRKEIVDLLLG